MLDYQIVMCGIAGYFGLTDGEPLLRAMNNAQTHRGPDGEGYFAQDLLGFAHRRLAIIDRAHGAQPMFNADKSLALVYNGEIYNYHELRSELAALGYVCNTDSDTEVILQAYAAWGVEAFDKFNGMFAFALYDTRAKKLLLVRDHFGIKPLYVANLGTAGQPKILFGSEIKTILASNKVPKKPNDRVIYRYLRFRIHEDSSETFFAGINKLMPGQMMIVDQHGTQTKMYTKLQDQLKVAARQHKPYDAGEAEQYRAKLTQAIKMRLVGEVPIGTSFSGGLDSSTVVAIVNQLMQQDKTATTSVGPKQNAFSAIFPNSANDEERYVDELLHQCQGSVTAHKIKPDADTFVKDLTDFIKTQEEPLISTGPYAQYKVMQAAAGHVTVLLDGQGADETMAGYIPYYFVYLRQLRAQKRWGTLAAEMLQSIDILLRFARVNVKERLLRKTPVPTLGLLGKDFTKAYVGETFSVVRDNLKLRLLQDTFVSSLPSLLRYEDKNTMRFSLEGRVPFLDKDVIAYLFTLSDDAIIKAGWNKRILRDATRSLLPDMINRRRNKIGFTTPEHEWFMRLKNRFYGIFLSESFAARPYFNQPVVVEAFEGFIKGKNDSSSMQFWRLLNVELWLREFFDEKPNEATAHTKTDLEPNQDKQLDITVNGAVYCRYALRTDLVNANDNLETFVTDRLQKFSGGEELKSRDWYLLISEKIVAITQGRSYFIWDIEPGWWARFLSKRVTKTPYGIGLGSPWTMQLAIQEVGLGRILYASIGSAVGKIFGKRGLFYNLVGSDIRAIDGPTEYSVYPSNVSAKLAPKDPNKVARQLSVAIRKLVPPDAAAHFKGVVVIDSNDIGRNVLGQNTSQTDKLFEDIFADNPLGQAGEQTPLCVVVKESD